MTPLQYQGDEVTGCVKFDGKSRCPSKAGQWIACGRGAAGAAGEVEGNTTVLQDTDRVTSAGQSCELPIVYGVRDACI